MICINRLYLYNDSDISKTMTFCLLFSNRIKQQVTISFHLSI